MSEQIEDAARARVDEIDAVLIAGELDASHGAIARNAPVSKREMKNRIYVSVCVSIQYACR